jgi:hypothetical protein
VLRRVLTVALAVATICTTPLVAGAAERITPRERQCRFQWMDPGIWTGREEFRTAVCVVEKWSVPGGLSVFRCVIGKESGWYRKAYNPAGPYLGLGQHVASAWDDRVINLEPYYWQLDPSWKNSRSQMAVSAQMMHAGVDALLTHWPNTGRECLYG